MEFSEKDFDVIGFAKKIMSEIESIRSFDKTTDESTILGQKVPSESRINAFFRLIGLPMFVSVDEFNNGKRRATDIKFLNPGFSKSVSSLLSDKEVNDSNATYSSIYGKEGKFWDILGMREIILKTTEESIGTNDMNERMAKALCSPLDVRANFPEEEMTKEIDFIPKSQPRGGNDTENSRKVFKRLFPLITSYREILPLRNEIARPFTLSERERMIDRNTILRKPFLEQVIRIRFVDFGSSNNEEEKQKKEDLKDSIIALIGEEQYDSIFALTFSKINLLEEFIINKFIGAIKNLARKWVVLNERDRIGLLREVRPTTSVKTGSAKNMFGKRIQLSSIMSGTRDGEKLKKINRAISEEELLMSLLPTDENEEGEVKQANTKNITPSALQNPFTDILAFNLNKNKQERDALLSNSKKNIKRLERMRLELDAMTGEFTGLSLPDVVIVLTALFIIDRSKLLNLLDKYTVDKMREDEVLKVIVEDITPSQANALNAIYDLEFIVNQLYSLFQKEVEIKHNRGNKGREGRDIRSSDEKTSSPVCSIKEE